MTNNETNLATSMPNTTPPPSVSNQKFPLSEKEQYTSDTMWYAQQMLAAYYENEWTNDNDDELLSRANYNKLNMFVKYGKRVLEPEDDVDTYGMITYERLMKDLPQEMNASQTAKEILDMYVMWICHDSKTTCPICRGNHLKTFKMQNLPVTHPNCRCGLILSPNINCSQEGLSKVLDEEFNKDQDTLHKLAHSYNNSDKAVDIILKYDDTITEKADKYEIDKALIQAILYREIRCYTVQDSVTDPLAHIPETDTFNTVVKTLDAVSNPIVKAIADLGSAAIKKSGKDIKVPDSVLKKVYNISVGLGQAKASSAINAMNLLNITKEDGTKYNENNIDDLKEIYDKLYQNDEFNIEAVAIILKANSLGLQGTPYSSQNPKAKLENITDPTEKTQAILGRYNGKGDNALSYGKYSYLYYEWFKAYENCGREEYSADEVVDMSQPISN